MSTVDINRLLAMLEFLRKEIKSLQVENICLNNRITELLDVNKRPDDHIMSLSEADRFALHHYLLEEMQ